MINKKLIKEVNSSLRYIKKNVICQWGMLLLNILLITMIAWFISSLFMDTVIDPAYVLLLIIIAIAVILVRYSLACRSAVYSEKSSREVKQQLREKIYHKILAIGGSYHEKISTSELIQVCVEGVDQLEVYFSSYLPQFFYSMMAPLTLFVVLLPFNWKASVVLFLCVPLIPVSIAAVQTFAKRLLSRYWGQYTKLGDHFLENLQGLTTLKIYQADERQQQLMNEEAEKFRKITMKVLTMQLNSITIMDLVAFGGAALGIGITIIEFQHGAITLQAALMTVLLAAEFFIPMRLLGSYFHIAMNGMAASDKIFSLIEMPVAKQGIQPLTERPFPIVFSNVSFSYDPDKEVIHDLNMKFDKGSFSAIIGESGCGKSTTASLLMGELTNYSGEIRFGMQDAKAVMEKDRLRWITRVSYQSYLFAGTVKENLCLAKPSATDKELWDVLEKVQLASYLKEQKGLYTILKEQGSNFSGGQRQRLALARALLQDSDVYVFDEATSNIDIESENLIMQLIEELARKKTVILITHRLANVRHADQIYVMEKGQVVEQGDFHRLCKQKGTFNKLWNAQQALENYGKEKEDEKKWN